MAWKPTTLWKPGISGTASGGKAMQCSDTGALGFCKPKDIGQEKICSDLARELGLSVPEVRLTDQAEGYAGRVVAVSIAHGSVSQDIAMLRGRYPNVFSTPPIQDALRAASGLLAFHAWVGTTDLKDEHLVYADDGRGHCTVAAIDFAYSLDWRVGSAVPPVTAPLAPAALIAAVDKAAVQQAVDRIESLTETKLKAIIDAVPDSVLPPDQKARIFDGLKQRRGQVRNVMHKRGWI